jgi:hypothetical protein
MMGRHMGPGSVRWAGSWVVAVFLLGIGCQRAVEIGVPAGAHDIPMEVLKGAQGQTLALVPVYLEGKGPLAFALDTGASRSTVDRRVAVELGLPVAGRAEQVEGVGGKVLARPVDVHRWRVGAIDLPASTLDVIDLSANGRAEGLQGLLGSDVLSRFKVITVDYQRQRLIFNPGPSGTIEPHP